MKEYYLGFGNWKAAQLYEARARDQSGSEARSDAVKAAQSCSKHMQAAISQDARFAEAHAIEALCEGLPQTLRAGGARAVNSCGRSKGLQMALKLEPGNPRVRLVEYLCHEDPSDARAALRFDRLQDVVAAFEAAPASRPGRPDWGEAEALVLMGEEYLRRGDSVAARNALERALVLAPDFHAAQEMLQTASARPL
jgi:tetratricopeptide (TPR) repeat protein